MCFHNGQDINVLDRMAFAVSQPAPRYWISESRAAIIVYEIERGKYVSNHFELRERMYHDIYARYQELRKQRPDDSVFSIVFDIVNSEAPESYLTPNSAKTIMSRFLSRMRNGSNTAIDKARRLSQRIQQIQQNKIQHENDFSSTVDDDYIDIFSCAASASIADGSEPVITDSQPHAVEDAVHLPSQQPVTSAHQHILSAEPLFPCRRKSVAVHSIDPRRVDYSIRARRKHTNIRYLSSQLCIDWFGDNEE